MDIRVDPMLRIRGEVRNFYFDLPRLNVRGLNDCQHNALIPAAS
ncbi:MAG: hypothetical protein AABN33_28030 [Acidobacteriota bacterium]